MKAFRNVLAACYGNALRQHGVESAQKLFALPVAFGSEVAAEHIGVNSRVGTAARNRLYLLAEYTLCGIFQLTLNSTKPGLKLIAVEFAAVIHQRKFNVSHHV